MLHQTVSQLQAFNLLISSTTRHEEVHRLRRMSFLEAKSESLRTSRARRRLGEDPSLIDAL